MTFKAIRIVALTLTLALLLTLSIPGAGAQGACPPGMSPEDCGLVETAAANTATSGSFTMTFSLETSFDTMGMAVAQSAAGSGSVQLDEAGNIVAMSLMMPEVSSEIPFMGESAGAAGFVLVDGVVYFGAGETADALEWRSASVDVLGTDLSFAALAEVPDSGDMMAPVVPIDDWTRSDAQTSDGRPAILISGVLEDGSIVEMMNETVEGVEGAGMGDIEGMEELQMLFGGMDGSFSGSTSIFIDPQTQALIEFSTSNTLDMSMDMSGFMEESGLGEGGEDAEGMEEMGDLFGDMLGTIGGGSTLNVTFADFGVPVAVTAPAASTPIEEPLLSSVSGSFNGVTALIMNYFNALAGESMGDGMFDEFGGGFDMNMYFGNCTADSGYTIVEAGSIASGSAVEDTLGAGEAKLWQFEGSAGSIVDITMSGDFDGYIELLGPNGNGLTSVDDTIGLMPALSGYELPESGMFTIVACGYSTFEEGPYTLELSN